MSLTLTNQHWANSNTTFFFQIGYSQSRVYQFLGRRCSWRVCEFKSFLICQVGRVQKLNRTQGNNIHVYSRHLLQIWDEINHQFQREKQWHRDSKAVHLVMIRWQQQCSAHVRVVRRLIACVEHNVICRAEQYYPSSTYCQGAILETSLIRPSACSEPTVVEEWCNTPWTATVWKKYFLLL